MAHRQPWRPPRAAAIRPAKPKKMARESTRLLTANSKGPRSTNQGAVPTAANAILAWNRLRNAHHDMPQMPSTLSSETTRPGRSEGWWPRSQPTA